MKTVTRGQYFVTIHDIEMAKLGCSGPCREYTFPRKDWRSRSKGWIQGDTRIGLALEVGVSDHRGHYGIEIEINSLLNDGSHPWVMIS